MNKLRFSDDMVERAAHALAAEIDGQASDKTKDMWIQAAREALRAALGDELSTGRIAVLGNDIGVVGAVLVEVEGVPVCRLAPMAAGRQMHSTGRSETTLTFGRGYVRWAGDAVGVVSEGDPNA